MEHQGKGKFGVEFEERDRGMVTSWFKDEPIRNEAYGNYCRGSKYSNIKKVQR